MSAPEGVAERVRRLWLARLAVRLQVVWRARAAARRRPREALRYLIHSRELSNFTYELANMDELVQMVATALAVAPAEVEVTVAELADDERLRGELAAALRANPKRDDVPRYGYRYIYYCVVRLLRPRVVIEVGTHDGLGAAVLLRALERNGDGGELITIDNIAASGWLIPERLAGGCTRELGDALETIGPLIERRGCDFLIDDIGFTFAGKPQLFEAALMARRGPLVIASEFPDRAPADPPTALARAAVAHGGRYAEFTEDPRDHFWPGHAQGVAAFEGSGPAPGG